jgi:hypothetical protein
MLGSGEAMVGRGMQQNKNGRRRNGEAEEGKHTNTGRENQGEGETIVDDEEGNRSGGWRLGGGGREPRQQLKFPNQPKEENVEKAN